MKKILFSIFLGIVVILTESHSSRIVSINSHYCTNDNSNSNSNIINSIVLNNIITASNVPRFTTLESKTSPKRSQPTFFYSEDESATHSIDLSKQKWSRKFRLDFIKKVYSIFTAQILSTVIITSIIMNNPSLSNFLQLNFKVVSGCSFMVSTSAVLALILSLRCRHRSPLNFLLLGVFTLFQSIIVGTFSSLFDPRTVCFGSMHTLSALVAITLYAFQPNPKYDLTASGNVLLAALATLTTGTILNFFFQMPMVDNLLSGLMAVVFAGYIAHDTQMIVGGKSKRQYATDDYMLAALNLYQDAISLYIQIMKILGRVKNKNKD